MCIISKCELKDSPERKVCFILKIANLELQINSQGIRERAKRHKSEVKSSGAADGRVKWLSD